MKILVDGRLISKNPTGISRYSLELIESYIEKYGENNLTVLLNNDVDIKCVKVFTKLKPYNLFHFLLFPFLISVKKYDVFHIPFYVGPFIVFNKKVKIILTIHDLMFLLVPNFFSKIKILNHLGKLYYGTLVRLSLNVSDVIISVSKTTQRDLIDNYKKKSLIIPEGINLRLESNLTSSDCNKRLLENNFFLYVGNNRPHKNVDFLIDVFNEYSGINKLVIVGHSKNKSHKNKNLIYLSNISDSELKELYQNCRAFIFPSKYEGFGLPILEAIANRAIVFSSNQGALKEFSFKSLYFFDPLNKMELLELMHNIDKYKFNKQDLDLLSAYDWKKNFNIFHNYMEVHFKIV